MHDFYIIPMHLRIAVSALGIMVVIAQSFYVSYIYFEHFGQEKNVGKQFFESFLLLYLLMLAAIPAAISMAIDGGGAEQSLLRFPRLSVFILLFCTGSIFWHKDKSLLSVVLLTAPTLPFMEKLPPYFFVTFYIFVLLFHLYRGVQGWMNKKYELSNEISPLSVKEAVDSLSSGLLFYETDGQIVLINRKMQELMFLICKKPFMDGIRFQKYVWERDRKNVIEMTELNGLKGVMLRLPEEGIWWFSQNEIHIGKKMYFQISASNISRQWELIDELAKRNKMLLEKSRKLHQLIDNLFQICHHQEILQMRNKLHDILGQNISLFIRRFEEGDNLSREELLSWITNLIAQLYTRSSPNPQTRLEEIKSVFESIGVAIRRRGELPKRVEAAEAFVSIIREASTNAVRHSLATKVEIAMCETDKNFALRIQDNGTFSKKNILPGGGIRSMEYSAGKAGGLLRVETSPRFTVIAKIPKEKYIREEEKL